MTLEIYLAYIAACFLIAVVPGPTVTVIVANSPAHGTRLTAMAIALVTDGGYAVLTGRAGALLSRKRIRLVSRLSGTCLIGGGLWALMYAQSFAEETARPIPQYVLAAGIVRRSRNDAAAPIRSRTRPISTAVPVRRDTRESAVIAHLPAEPAPDAAASPRTPG